jgi:hypothetical protein
VVSRLVLSILGFLLSIVFILAGMIVMMRFWTFTSILYHLFVVTILFVGIMTNVLSINLFLSEQLVISFNLPVYLEREFLILFSL